LEFSIEGAGIGVEVGNWSWEDERFRTSKGLFRLEGLRGSKGGRV
jgi:hypothetical protein